jgi:hypothetical protein
MLSQQFELIDLGSCRDLWHTVPLGNICERSQSLGLSGFCGASKQTKKGRLKNQTHYGKSRSRIGFIFQELGTQTQPQCH